MCPLETSTNPSVSRFHVQYQGLPFFLSRFWQVERDDHGRGRNWKQSPEVTAIIHDFPQFVKFNMTKQLKNIYPMFCQMGTTSSLWSMWHLERVMKMWLQLTKTHGNYGEVEIPVLVWFLGQPTNKEIISVENHLPMKKIMPTNKERLSPCRQTVEPPVVVSDFGCDFGPSRNSITWRVGGGRVNNNHRRSQTLGCHQPFQLYKCFIPPKGEILGLFSSPMSREMDEQVTLLVEH